MEITPLCIASTRTPLYVNLTGAAETVMVWVAAHGADGRMAIARPEDQPTRFYTVAAGAPAMAVKCSVPANEAVILLPGEDGTLAARLTDGK